MAPPIRRHPWSEVSLRIAGALVVWPLKILYVPVPKAACTTLKRLLAEAAGTYDEAALMRLTTPNITPEQAIHEPEVSGFTYFRYLPDSHQQEILASPEWWRVTAVRNPYARVYSAFENNLVMFGGTLKDGFDLLYREVLTEGRLNLSATFEDFLRKVARDPRVAFTDDHFRPQVWHISPDVVDYTHHLKVEAPGEIDGFARELCERAGREVLPRRLNEGLGYKYRDVVSADVARLIEGIYWPDFQHLGYEHEMFPATVAPAILSERETRLVHVIQRMWLRQWQMSIAGLSRRGARYGLREIARRGLNFWAQMRVRRLLDG